MALTVPKVDDKLLYLSQLYQILNSSSFFAKEGLRSGQRSAVSVRLSLAVIKSAVKSLITILAPWVPSTCSLEASSIYAFPLSALSNTDINASSYISRGAYREYRWRGYINLITGVTTKQPVGVCRYIYHSVLKSPTFLDDDIITPLSKKHHSTP
ncbi:hypothetical protein BDY19DRAFT_1051774 [Irpex rosettiformis]|uniref:Uncharacterized protein n=2 Tax=Irpex rosettiformis TaxID=378272 RepID=A0ACB8TND2_9APHY|nr:hypothetical protein BDY19DRAFT_1051964 [Irpex rosettiformis]KAI0083526.1 hypothetical protein BDY19DRAFT_1051774 [Irpex rosettiformis]